MENITTIFKDLMKDSLESFNVFCTCCFTSFLTSFYGLPYNTRVDQHDAKKSMFYGIETSPLPPCMAQECAMLYDTLWHIQGRSCRAQGRSCRAQGRSCRARGAAVGNIGIPTYVISRGAVVRQPINVCPPPFFGKMFTKSTDKNRVGPPPSNCGVASTHPLVTYTTNCLPYDLLFLSHEVLLPPPPPG